MPWQPLPLSYAVAIYPFQPGPSPSELPLQIGDQLYVIEQGGKDGAWCRGYLLAAPSLLSAMNPNGRNASDARVFSGIFPRCCIEIREELGSADAKATNVAANSEEKAKPQAPVPLLKVGDESISSSSEPLVDEISSCLREWYVLHLPELVLRRQYDVLDRMSQITTRLDYARRQLLNDVLTVQERMTVRDQAVWDLVRGNKMLSGEVIVRDATQHGRLLTADDPVIEVSKLQSVMSVLDAPPVDKHEPTSLNHCLLEVKSVTGTELDSTTLNFALYEKSSEGNYLPLSETFSAPASSEMRTLLADLNARDVASDDHLYLVVKVVSSEPPRNAYNNASDRPSSRNGVTTTKVAKQEPNAPKRRSSLIFPKRKGDKDRPESRQNGRLTPQKLDRSVTPIIPEEEAEDENVQQVTGPPLPRTVGVGVIDIARVMRGSKIEENAAVTVWSASSRPEESLDEFDPLVRSFLHSPTKSYTICNRISRIEFSLTPFASPDAETLIRNNPTQLHLVSKTQKMGFSEAPSKARSDIYFTLKKADIVEGSQLNHPEVGLTRIRADHLLNLQLTMEVRDSAGRRVDQCIHVASNAIGVTAFRTNAAEIGSDWDQTVCLRIPTNKVAECHLVLSVADAPEFPFALAWMPLWDKQAFLSDGPHSLILHAYDKSTSSIVRGRGAYLSLPWNNANFEAGNEGVKGTVASLAVATKLCSTEYSQDRLLVSLISWKHQSSIQLLDILQKLVFVPEIEIVKQLNDVLDALFAVMVHKSGESKYEDLVFNDIVFVLGIVHDRRFNLGPLVEQYAETHFHAPLAASGLVRSLTRMLQSVSDPQSAREMRALFKVGKQFMKLLMASYHERRTSANLSQRDKEKDKKHTTFKEDMQAVLFGLQMMMRSETPALVGSKTLLIQNFHTWLPEMLPVYTKDEVIKIAFNFVDSSESATGKLALYRLIMILNYAKIDQLWMDNKDRGIFIKNCLRWLAPHWIANNMTDDWREQVRLCCSIVAELCRHPVTQLHEFMPRIINAYCYIVTKIPEKKKSLSLLFSQTYPFVRKTAVVTEQFDETLIELAALMATITKIQQLEPPKLQDQDLSTYILANLTVLRSLLNNDGYPATWLSLHTHHHVSALSILSYIGNMLHNSFIPVPEEAENFDMPLWKAYLETLLALVSSPSLMLESFSEQKRRVVWKIAGDVRQAGADLLRRSWEALGWEATPDDMRRYNIQRLGGYQVQYVPSLVGPVIELCLGMHEGQRRAAVEILQSMIVSEWALGEDLGLLETEVIGALNAILKDRVVSANEAMGRKLFIGELLGLFSTIANQPDDALWTALEDLVATIEELIDLLTSTIEEEEEEEVAVANAAAAHNATTASAVAAPLANNPISPTSPTVKSGVSGANGDMEIARRNIDRMDTPRETKEYGTQALECYKQLADEYERAGDYKRLAKTYRAIARIHEARAASRMVGGSSIRHDGRATANGYHDSLVDDDDENLSRAENGIRH